MKTVLYLLVVVLACLLSSSALGLTAIGPPVATLDEGQFAAGFAYCHSKIDVEVTALGLTVIAKDGEIDTYMANLMFGIAPNWELQIDLGAANTESTKGDFAGGFGLKTTFRETDKIKWGVVTTAHWYQVAGSGEIAGVPYTEEDRWNEIQIALGPSYEDGKWRLYGGPFLHFIDGEGDVTVGGIDFSGDFKQDSIFGGFVGAQVDIPFVGNDNVTLGIEYQRTESADALAASILFRF